MDKITRTLLLYSRLIKGEKVNKFAFCMETDCIPRTFDRDIEDVRLYLSETFDARELLYDRHDKVYYLSGVSRTELESVEYLLIERLLLDTGVLRQDELEVLLKHVLSNTEKSMINLRNSSGKEKIYTEPVHKKAILKMHGDLAIAIHKQAVIQIKYLQSEELEEDIEIIPCCLKYDDGYLYLIAYLVNTTDEMPIGFRLDKIYSFKLQRTQLYDEKQSVDKYLKKDSSYFINVKEKAEGGKMAKKIRFPLEMENNVQVRTLEELQENFSLERILVYLDNGKLVTWLNDRYLNDIAEKVIALDLEDEELNKKVCQIFDVEYDESSEIDMELAAERNRKIGLLKETGFEQDFIDVIDQIAFEQDDIYDLLDEEVTTIYLCGEKFAIPLSKAGIRYIGIDCPTVVISSKEKVNFEEKEITFENIKFDEKYQEVLNEYEKQEAKAKNAFGEYVENTYTKLFMNKQDVEASKITYNVLAKELEELAYDVSDDTRNIMEYLLSTGVEDWGTDYLIDGGDTYMVRNYLSNSGLENFGIEYLENA